MDVNSQTPGLFVAHGCGHLNQQLGLPLTIIPLARIGYCCTLGIVAQQIPTANCDNTSLPQPTPPAAHAKIAHFCFAMGICHGHQIMLVLEMHVMPGTDSAAGAEGILKGCEHHAGCCLLEMHYDFAVASTITLGMRMDSLAAVHTLQMHLQWAVTLTGLTSRCH